MQNNKRTTSITDRPDRPEIQTGNFNRRSNSMLKRVVKARQQAATDIKKSSNTSKKERKS